MKTVRVLFALACLACQQATTLADGLIRDGIGPISTGRGGTNQGFADNSAIILDNPGAMVNVDCCGLAEFGADTVITDVDYTNPLNDVQSKIRPLPMPVFGYIRKSEDDQWAYGIGAFAPAGFGASYGVMNQAVLGPNLYKSLGGLGKLLPGASYRVTERLSVGATVGIAFSYVELEGPLFLQSGALAGVPAVVDLQGFGVAPTGSIGLQYRLTSDTVLGATYTEQTDIDLRGTMQAVVVPGFPIASDFDSKIRMTWPRSVAIGLRHDWNPEHRIGVDVIWYDWSAAFDEIGLDLINPSNPVIPALLGSSSIRDIVPLHWHDSVSLRLGYEWFPNERDTWRAGYAYHRSPVPDSTLCPYLDGVLEHAFSAGFSRRLNGAVLNVAYQYNFSPQRQVGQSAILGQDFDNSSMKAQAHFAMVSLLIPF